MELRRRRTCAAVVGAARAFAACFVHGTLIVLSSEEAKGSSDRGRTCVDRDECVFVVVAGRGPASAVPQRRRLQVVAARPAHVDRERPLRAARDRRVRAGSTSTTCGRPRTRAVTGRYGQACVATEDGAVVLMGGVFIEETFEERRVLAQRRPQLGLHRQLRPVDAHAIIITGGCDSDSDTLDDVWQSSDGPLWPRRGPQSARYSSFRSVTRGRPQRRYGSSCSSRGGEIVSVRAVCSLCGATNDAPGGAAQGAQVDGLGSVVETVRDEAGSVGPPDDEPRARRTNFAGIPCRSSLRRRVRPRQRGSRN